MYWSVHAQLACHARSSNAESVVHVPCPLHSSLSQGSHGAVSHAVDDAGGSGPHKATASAATTEPSDEAHSTVRVAVPPPQVSEHAPHRLVRQKCCTHAAVLHARLAAGLLTAAHISAGTEVSVAASTQRTVRICVPGTPSAAVHEVLHLLHVPIRQK